MSAHRTSRWSLFHSSAASEDEALREREAILTMAEQSAGIGVWDIDLTTSTARATPQFFRIMGLEATTDAVPMERLRGLRHPDDRERVLAGFRQAVDSGNDAYEMEYRIIRPDGQVRWIFGRGRVVRDGSGKPVRYSGVDIDITERKETAAALAAAKEALERANAELEQRVQSRTAELEAEARKRAEAEARLHQAQKMEAVGQLTGGVAHDFNNILQVIMGNLEILKRTLLHYEPQGTRARELWLGPVDTALQATRNAAQLTHRLLAFSRLQPLAPALLDVNQLITDMSVIIRHTIGETISFASSLEPGLWAAFADRNQLETALLNLVVNARDAMPQGGRLALETSNIDIADPYPAPVDELKPGEYIVLAVSDTGVGIPPENVGKVFEPFFTTKEIGKGSGLGLSMVYGFVKQSGGHVRIHSRVGQGTTVRLYLPRAAAEKAEPRAPVSAPLAGSLPRAKANETVLVVEDNEEVRRYGVSALQGLGYQVVQAPDGAAALALLEEAAVQKIDLLFSDVVLPGGLTGRDLAERVRQRFPGLPVLFASGYPRDPVLSSGPLEHGVLLLAKPYDLESLAKGVRQAIDR